MKPQRQKRSFNPEDVEGVATVFSVLVSTARSRRLREERVIAAYEEGNVTTESGSALEGTGRKQFVYADKTKVQDACCDISKPLNIDDRALTSWRRIALESGACKAVEVQGHRDGGGKRLARRKSAETRIGRPARKVPCALCQRHFPKTALSECVSRMSIARLQHKWKMQQGIEHLDVLWRDTLEFFKTVSMSRAYNMCGVCPFCQQFFHRKEKSVEINVNGRLLDLPAFQAKIGQIRLRHDAAAKNNVIAVRGRSSKRQAKRVRRSGREARGSSAIMMTPRPPPAPPRTPRKARVDQRTLRRGKRFAARWLASKQRQREQEQERRRRIIVPKANASPYGIIQKLKRRRGRGA
eukprot:g2768.t1